MSAVTVKFVAEMDVELDRGVSPISAEDVRAGLSLEFAREATDIRVRLVREGPSESVEGVTRMSAKAPWSCPWADCMAPPGVACKASSGVRLPQMHIARWNARPVYGENVGLGPT